jgi:MFS superfamily sulfate permease-like transporter
MITLKTAVRISCWTRTFRNKPPSIAFMAPSCSDKISTITDHISSLSAIVILRLRNMTTIDATGVAALEELAELLQKNGRSMLVCGARPQPEALMREAARGRETLAKILPKY